MFVANATAGIKLVAEALRDYAADNNYNVGEFTYAYHVDSHTSLAGARELAASRRCLRDEGEVQAWMEGLAAPGSGPGGDGPALFAYPAQSNMTGRRLPRSWCADLRRHAASAGRSRDVFSLLDAASLASTTPLNLSGSDNDPEAVPDFTVLSFYKIFGFPDLGALIVRKDAAHVFEKRRYFGGGTVGMVINFGSEWYARKDTSIHEALEDGTLPFHDIVALDCAMSVHERVYGARPMENISRHTIALSRVLYDRLSSLRHASGRPVCAIYTDPNCRYGDSSTQGPLMSLNMLRADGSWVGKSDVDKLAAVKDVQLRSGGLCNPGGTAVHLGLTDVEMRRNYAAGVRCGNEMDVVNGKPTGQLRVSLGAMTNVRDIERLVALVDEFYVEKPSQPQLQTQNLLPTDNDLTVRNIPSLRDRPRFFVDTISVYPIKSCGAFAVPENTSWQIKPEGLAWDREWCLVHQGTGAALNQKRYPRMALIRPFIDLGRGVLRVSRGLPPAEDAIEVPLSWKEDGEYAATTTTSMCAGGPAPTEQKSSTVCGDRLMVHVYSSASVAEFFSSYLDVPCTLARFPTSHSSPTPTSASSPSSSTSAPASATRYSKAWERPSHPNYQQHHQRPREGSESMPGAFPDGDDTVQPLSKATTTTTHLRLSNESPLLLISRSSVNKINELIKAKTQPDNDNSNNNRSTQSKVVAADVFRANIVVAEDNLPQHESNYSSAKAAAAATSIQALEHPFVEDTWRAVRVGTNTETKSEPGRGRKEVSRPRLDVLGPCQRCQMVCVDQRTGQRGTEPFATLSKTRKVGGKVLFGRHVCVSSFCSSSSTTLREVDKRESAGGDGDEDEGVWVCVGDVVRPVYEGDEDEDGVEYENGTV